VDQAFGMLDLLSQLPVLMHSVRCVLQTGR
jgi:hypothetical protein